MDCGTGVVVAPVPSLSPGAPTALRFSTGQPPVHTTAEEQRAAQTGTPPQVGLFSDKSAIKAEQHAAGVLRGAKTKYKVADRSAQHPSGELERSIGR